jgi:pimeloyl-ACP methyl ester carboxylesterase
VLAFDRRGAGPPLLLIHGTTSSRRVWDPLVQPLTARNEVLAIDLPGHGDSPATSHSPSGWAVEVASLLDHLEIERLPILGHSSGGWTALELARLGRAENVLALAPAGLWRHRSPVLTGLILRANWQLGRLAPNLTVAALRSPAIRSIALRSASAKPGDVPQCVAIESAKAVIAAKGFPQHFRETRRQRFTGGHEINVPVKVIWGEQDRIAIAGKSRHADELPAHTDIETWPGCGHMLMWDAPQRVLAETRRLVG